MIRLAQKEDFNTVWLIYREAQEFMRQTGNPDQWGDFYPTHEVVQKDIDDQKLRLVVRNDEICGVFFLDFEPDPWYAKIDGAWLSDAPYGVIHRVAAKTSHKGVFKETLDYCLEQTTHLRIDTHEDNKVMQHILEKNGFQRCGIVYVHERQTPRIAYERI